MLVVALEPQLGGVVHRVEHLGLVVPVIRVGELDDLDIVTGHPVDPQHQLDALLLLDAPPVVLDRVQALGQPDLLALELDHPVQVVAGADHQAATLTWGMRGTEEPGAPDVGVDVDRGEQATEADQVVHVVDVVRVPVVLPPGAQEGVLDAELLELLTGPAQLLVDVARRHQGAVGVVDLAPVQGNGAALRGHVSHSGSLLSSRTTHVDLGCTPTGRLLSERRPCSEHPPGTTAPTSPAAGSSSPSTGPGR